MQNIDDFPEYSNEEEKQNYNEFHNPENLKLSDKEFFKKFKPKIIDYEGDRLLKKMKSGYF